MKVTKILIAPLKKTRLKAVVSIVFDDVFKVRNIKILPRKHGNGLYVSFPETRDEYGSYISVAYPLNKDYRKELENLILYEYDRKLMERETNGSSEADSVKQQLEDPDKEWPAD